MACRPPLEELRSIIEMTGYEVISIEPEYSHLTFNGAINIKIAPRKWIDRATSIDFPQISQNLVSSLRECTARFSRQADSNGQ